jgi:hypothetical protein
MIHNDNKHTKKYKNYNYIKKKKKIMMNLVSYLDTLVCVLMSASIDLPSQSEINEMREKLFGSLDGEEDDLDNTFQMLQSMRGNLYIKI